MTYLDNAPLAKEQHREGTSLRNRLRLATHGRHEALDHQFEGLGDDARPSLYEDFIRLNHAGRDKIEPILAASPFALHMPDWLSRRATPVLAEDMAAMRLEAVETPPFAIGQPDLPQAFGIAYVLEGSRLGAGLIHKQLRRTGFIDNHPALSFSFIQRSGDADVFRSYLAALSALDLSPKQEDRLIAAANLTFDFFRSTLSAMRKSEQGKAVAW
ncbi:Heme oxygenase [Consotaella salsifontis]|uniref:Heme oxygenase n=2 Tax=Consotaella salsifontis TaxID=1365950 RepID=A0A1T4Q251_9HYPH|nr:Heme oxygenase [Consotaella salsifontis]